jgi:hypothetical protein
MGTYRIAEVCPNGHVSTSSADTSPELREKYCSQCGEPTITQCLECKANIRGYYYVPGVVSIGHNYEPPTYCFNCGNPYPWTERKISGALELIKEEGELSNEEYQQFEKDLVELTKDSPKVQVASVRFKKVMGKVGNSIATGVREIVVDILSEAAKKALWD